MSIVKTIILGLGSEILTDDGIGSKIVRSLEEQSLFSNFDYKTALTGGLDILEIIKDYDHVLIIDAIKTAKYPAGTLLYFASENYLETVHLSSIHDADFQTIIELGNNLSYNMPQTIDIIAIEVKEIYEFSSNLSEYLENSFPDILQNIKKWLLKRFNLQHSLHSN